MFSTEQLVTFLWHGIQLTALIFKFLTVEFEQQETLLNISPKFT